MSRRRSPRRDAAGSTNLGAIVALATGLVLIAFALYAIRKLFESLTSSTGLARMNMRDDAAWDVATAAHIVLAAFSTLAAWYFS